MTRNIVELSDWNSVSPGQKATLDVPVGPLMYHQLRIKYGTATAGGANQANMEAEIKRVRLNLNGVTQREFTAAELFAINAYRGVPFRAGSLPIFLSHPWQRTPQGEDGLAWRVGDIDTFHVEVELDSGANAPTLEARAAIDNIPVDRSAMGDIVKWKRLNVDNSAIGVRNFTQFAKEDPYYTIHCFSGDIKDVRLETDRIVRWDLTDDQMSDFLLDQGFAPQAGMYHIDFASTARVLDVLDMEIGGRRVGTFKVDFDMGAANGFDVVTETIGPRD